MRREQVATKIIDAFSQERFPKEAELFIPSGGHIFDIEKAVAGLNYEKWSQIPLQSLIRNRDRISYLTEVGFHFLLPAFLIAAINHPRQVDVLVDSVICALVPPDRPDWHERFTRRAKTLSDTQGQAILCFFESYTEIYPIEEWSFSPEDEDQVKKAIEFWRSWRPQSE